jgi:NADP-dependent 3-hydroxy acid dehydrogenase YdfG
MAETDWLIEAKTAYERGNAYAATAAALMDIANTLRIQNGRD